MAEDTRGKLIHDHNQIGAGVFVLALLALIFGGTLLLGTFVKSGVATANPVCRNCSRPETPPARAQERQSPRAGRMIGLAIA